MYELLTGDGPAGGVESEEDRQDKLGKSYQEARKKKDKNGV